MQKSSGFVGRTLRDTPFKAKLTLFCDAVQSNSREGAHDMGMEHEQSMQARAELARMIDDLGHLAMESGPILYLNALDDIRRTAVQSGVGVLADIIGRLESDLHGAATQNAMMQSVEAYREWMDVALGAVGQDSATREAVFAAMAVRRGAA